MIEQPVRAACKVGSHVLRPPGCQLGSDSGQHTRGQQVSGGVVEHLGRQPPRCPPIGRLGDRDAGCRLHDAREAAPLPRVLMVPTR